MKNFFVFASFALLMSMMPMKKDEAFVGTPVFVGNEPFSRLVFAVEGGEWLDIEDGGMLKKLAECQNMRIEIVGKLKKAKKPNPQHFSVICVSSFKILEK